MIGAGVSAVHALPEGAAARFDAFHAQLAAWNARMDLTAVLSEEEALYRHYLDSLTALPLLPQGASVVDVGTGAGFPGVPLLLADMVGGCETRNEAFFTAHGWAASCPPDNMAASALAFLEDEQQRQAITAAQSRDFDGLAADRVAAAVLARCKK